MKANIALLRSQLSKLLEAVQAGKELEIQKHNVTIAKIVPIKVPEVNRTKLGIGKGTAKVQGDLTEPLIEETDWQLSTGKF